MRAWIRRGFRVVQARPALTAFYFGLFVALVFIVCLNMFIGIVSRAFLEVHDDVKTSDRWKISAKHWEADVILMIHRQVKGASEAIKTHCARRKRANKVTRLNTSPSNGYLNGVTDKEIEVRDVGHVPVCVCVGAIIGAGGFCLSGRVVPSGLAHDVKAASLHAGSQAAAQH
jgi:hypothetical protein